MNFEVFNFAAQIFPHFRKKKTMARIILAVCLAVAALAFSDPDEPKKARGNLPSDSSLRIGVLKRVEECSQKSKKGDSLSMHVRILLISHALGVGV